MNILFRIIGSFLILLALRDVFHTLFHPGKHGSVSDGIARTIWRSMRAMCPGSLILAGPLAFVTIVAYWGVSIIVGFALIYLPELPRAFTFAAGLSSSGYSGFSGALELSLCSLITLSTGAYSTRLWLGLLLGTESILGFVLLTASVSWILSIYPVLEHRKSLAHQASLLHFSEVEGIRRLRDISDSDVNQILMGLASELSTSRHELMQFPITYYFHENEEKSSLAGMMAYLADIAEQNKNRKGSAALAATVLGGAVDDYLQWIAQTFLRQKFQSRDQILRMLADDHRRKIVRSPEPRARAA